MDTINPDTLAPTYGMYLRALREAKGLGDARAFARAIYGDVAKPAPSSQISNIWNWETGRTLPRGAVLGRIANALQVKVHSINPKHFKPAWMKRLSITRAAVPAVEDKPMDVAPPAESIITNLPEELRPLPGEQWGAFLKRMRLLRGYDTSKALGQAMDAGPSLVAKLERGAGPPMPETSAKLARLLDLPEPLMDKAQFDRIQDQGDEAVETYGEYIARLRRAAGYLNQTSFGRAYGERFKVSGKSSSALINKWETGYQVPSGASLDRLAQMLGISARTLNPERFVPGRLLPPTLKVVEPPAPPKPEPEVPAPQSDDTTLSADVAWDEGSREVVAETEFAAPAPSVRKEFGAIPQFLKQHVDIFGISQTDDPQYVRIKFDAVLPRKTAGGLMRELVILTTDDLLGGGED